MRRYFGVPEYIIDQARRVYRETNSLAAVVRQMRTDDLDPMYWDGVAIAVDGFGVDLSFTQWLNYWTAEPVTNACSLTDEELDANMRPLIEKNRHLWDRPAASDSEPKS